MTLMFPKSLYCIPSSILIGLSMVYSASFTSPVTAANIQEQRTIYDKAQHYLDRNQVAQYRQLRPKIKDYPLTPYTDYRAFLVNIAQRTPIEVENFIQAYNTLPFSNRIRAPYIDSLARNNQWEKLANFQSVEPKGETYQCHYYHALYQTGKKTQAFRGAKKLWHSGKSIADACDPLFKVWDKAGLRTDQQVLERMLLAFEARNGSLMNYLKTLLDSGTSRKQALEMKKLFNRPERVVTFSRQRTSTDFNRRQAELAVKKLARKDADLAQSVFSKVVSAQQFSQQDAQRLADYISFRLINTDKASLSQWRDTMIASSGNDALIERRIRLAIQKADWTGVIKWVAHLSESAQNTIRWQYWLGRSEVASGDAISGNNRLENLVGQRNFYSVAAAKEIQRSINYPVSSLSLEQRAVQPFMKALVRIEELVERDKITAAKSEWRWLLQRANAQQKEMLAAYASYKNWSHLSVTASITAKMWDNLEIRFPIAHRWWFDFYGEKHRIDPITLMSLARQESALDVEARSPVGARGIMQIMPSTAKYTARKYQLAYQSSRDLYEVGKNIEIGSHYFKGLLDQYDNNRIFALAAYNAGPYRVKTWRKRTQGKLDAYAFIEAIPFKETRGYVQNILMFETYYRDLLGVDGAFLNQNEIDTRY